MTQVQENVLNQVEEVFQPAQQIEGAQDARYDKVYDSEKFQKLSASKKAFHCTIVNFLYCLWNVIAVFSLLYRSIRYKIDWKCDIRMGIWHVSRCRVTDCFTNVYQTS